MTYTAIRHLHMTFALLSIGLFAMRGLLALCSDRWRGSRALRIAPHIIDTCLLASAITLLVLAGFNPLEHAWLMAKIIALLLYIYLGRQALRAGLARGVRLPWLIAALACAGYILGVAFTRSATWGMA